ncbi:MAG: hypothetical protein ACI8ZM_000407 [Crocinitomix sp.]|jgi:hypothetical protein
MGYTLISILNKRIGYTHSTFYDLINSLSDPQKNSISLYYSYLNQSGDPDYSRDFLNHPYETGEKVFEGLDFLKFIEEHFKYK